MNTTRPYLLGLLGLIGMAGLTLATTGAAHQALDEPWSGWPAVPQPVWQPAWQQVLDSLLSPAAAAAVVTIDGDYRVIASDGLPDHATGQFPNAYNPNRLRASQKTYRVPLKPVYRQRTVALGLWPFGVAVNGIPFDPGAAEFWRRDRRSGWQYEAMAGAVNLGLDRNNAHVQPYGSYHYHGAPDGLLDQFGATDAPILLGYAADGFPIYGPRGYRVAEDRDSRMIPLRSSYRLRDGNRPGGDDGPGGQYDGSFVQDYRYQAGLGDLDDCNGRYGVTAEYPDGTYHYVITTTFPFIPRCFHGEPDRSFLRGPGASGVHSPGGPGHRPERHAGGRQHRGDTSGRGRGNGRHGRRGQPPPEAFAACDGHKEGDTASFTSPFGHTVTGVCRELRGPLFLVPDHHRPPPDGRSGGYAPPR